jgi:hypothetical protein
VRHDGGEIGHRAGGKEQRRVFSEELGDTRFETSRCGVAIEVVVSNVSGGDGLAHWRRGPRDGVAAKIDGHGAEGRARVAESEGRTTGNVARRAPNADSP